MSEGEIKISSNKNKDVTNDKDLLKKLLKKIYFRKKVVSLVR